YARATSRCGVATGHTLPGSSRPHSSSAGAHGTHEVLESSCEVGEKCCLVSIPSLLVKFLELLVGSNLKAQAEIVLSIGVPLGFDGLAEARHAPVFLNRSVAVAFSLEVLPCLENGFCEPPRIKPGIAGQVPLLARQQLIGVVEAVSAHHPPVEFLQAVEIVVELR